MQLLKNYGLDIVFNTSPRDSVVSSLVHIARNKNKDIEFEYQKSALEVADDCGSAYYAEAKFYSETTEETPVYAIAAVPNSLAIAAGKNGTIQLMGLRNSPYANVLLDNTKVTFRSASDSAATVDENGVVTKVGEDPTTIIATYQGLSETINITTQLM